ncbi:MAG: hypothetical protein HYV63_05365 [Candidatus Schekmanbacteria bacterium]|nr:hypothetical protein [Candidatus Schekmanbacteria bacterium]
MTTIKRQDFTNQYAGRTIDLDKLQGNDAATARLAEAGVNAADVAGADANKDGRLDAAEAFRYADTFDSNGDSRSIAGSATQAGKVLGALEVGLDTPELWGANDNILFVGMGDGARQEYDNFRHNARGAVVGVTDSAGGDDTIKFGGATYDLATPQGCDDFVAMLGLPAEQSRQVSDAIAAAGSDTRDEMAQIAQVWAKAERGEPIPSRMVISGHHVGYGVWGDHNGMLTWEALGRLTRAMPTAAGQIQDLNISACYSGGDELRSKYKELFPNVETIWAYSGSAPGTYSGALPHQNAWERATRGDNTDVYGAAQGLVARDVRKAHNIEAAAVDQEYLINRRPLDELRGDVRAFEGGYQDFFHGQQTVQDPQQGPLRQYYSDLQAMLQHADLPASERQSLEERRDQAIRLLFYGGNVAPKFQNAYAAQIRAGYEALGMAPLNFGSMSRADALASIQIFRDRLANTSNPPVAAQNLLPVLNGLWNLDSRTIPTTWI